MTRPLLPAGTKRVRVDLTLAPSTVVMLDALAFAAGLSKSAFVERLVLGAEKKETRR